MRRCWRQDLRFHEHPPFRRVVSKQHKEYQQYHGTYSQRDFIFLKPAVLCFAISGAQAEEHRDVEEKHINPGEVTSQDAAVGIVGHRDEEGAGVEADEQPGYQRRIVCLQDIKIGHNNGKEKHGKKE